MKILRDVVRVAGPDAVSFLQGQVSQEVEEIAIGASAWALILEPQGKVDAFVRLTRSADDSFAVDLDAGFGAAVVERLERFKLRVKAELTVGGAVAVEVDPDVELTTPLAAFGPLTDAADVGDRWETDWEPIRIRLGIPAMGKELTGDTIPEEAGVVDVAVSFTKGCYTGQELVARIDSRGRNVAKRLRRVLGEATLSAGDELVVDGKVVGRVTSAAGVTGLAYVGRAVEPPAEVTASSAPGPGRMARVEALPPLR